MALRPAMSSSVRFTSRKLSGVLAHQSGDRATGAVLPGGDDPHGLVEHDPGQDLPFGDCHFVHVKSVLCSDCGVGQSDLVHRKRQLPVILNVFSGRCGLGTGALRLSALPLQQVRMLLLRQLLSRV